ncbi:9184_t:CDS:2 [Cetraspora pellucida]|uniref:9178_t:CDS:1 n=2 Tax=Cetraspora pellucida TaxID=1433469 RepID=A0ACA9JXH9_9GLOM|nr:9178_t:CDS:2 [Cetraspora pellucida]CAG8441246.1 9184_t:CDS:2 [Cetraspora pellucida]
MPKKDKIHEGTSIPEGQLSQDQKRNLYQKLTLIQSQIKELIRTEENKGQKYKFFNELQVLNLLKPLLEKYQLTILVSDTEDKELIYEKNNDPAKAKGSAETYAMKYFLSKLFLMPVKDEGDPDYSPREGEKREEATKLPPRQTITSQQVESLINLFRTKTADNKERQTKALTEGTHSELEEMGGIQAFEMAYELRILSKYPYKFYAYGSRVKGAAYKYSDLDICYQEAIPLEIISNLREEFTESDLPFFVELVNWKHMRPKFREMIKKDLKLKAEEAGEILRVIEESGYEKDETEWLKSMKFNRNLLLQYLQERKKEEKVVRKKSQRIKDIKSNLKKYQLKTEKLTPQDIEKFDKEEKRKKKDKPVKITEEADLDQENQEPEEELNPKTKKKRK